VSTRNFYIKVVQFFFSFSFAYFSYKYKLGDFLEEKMSSIMPLHFDFIVANTYRSFAPSLRRASEARSQMFRCALP